MDIKALKGTVFGPPYTTGQIHQGNAAAIIVKDFYYRYLKLKNSDLYKKYPYVLDTQGLPIEWKVEQNFTAKGIQRKDIQVKNWIEECLSYSDKNIEPLKNQISRLKLLCDVEKTPWIKTNDLDYKVKQLNFFSALYDRKKIYKDTKYVNYCLNCDISLSNAELELADTNLKKTYVLGADLHGPQNLKLIFATTCPHTIVNNIGLAIANKKYYKVRCEDTTYVVGHPAVIDLLPAGGVIAGTIDAAELAKNYSYKLNFRQDTIGLKHIVVDDFVKHKVYDESEKVDLRKDLLTAVACVHLSPWDSEIDNEICLKHNLLDRTSVHEQCLNRKNAKKDFIKQLILPASFCIKVTFVENDNYELYTCWRCKHLVDVTLTPQWFIKISAEDRKLLTQHVLKLKTNNSGFLNKFLKWCTTEDKDWCISRSRHYGTPLPYVSCKNSFCSNNRYQAVYFKPEDFNVRSDCYSYNLKTILERKSVRCGECNRVLENDDFCLDVWADSGFLPYYLSDAPDYEFLMEGQDQNRGFFYVVAVLGVLKDKKIPYGGLIYTPWFITAQKKKISKSEGAGGNFLSLLNTVGIENFRSYCLSKCDGNPSVFDTNAVMLEKKYTNAIKNLKLFLNQAEYVADFETLDFYKTYFEQKDETLCAFIDAVFNLEKKLTDFFLAGKFDSYWIHLREFILHEYSRSLVNQNKMKARTDKNYAAVIKHTGALLLSLCAPVLGD